jgi:hypothetical protein
MLLNLLVLLIWAPSLLGLGAAWRTLLALGTESKPATNDVNPGVIMSLGFVPLAIVSASIHFFLPLSVSISVVMLVLGYALLIRERQSIAGMILPPQRLLGALPVMMLVCLFASRPLRHFDTGLYHIQSVKWCTDYPLVRGLANLHERLAFNSLWTPISAVVDFPRFGSSACFPITCLLLFAFGWAVYDAIYSWKSRTHSLADCFLAGCGCFWMWLVIADSALVILPSLSSDAPIYFTTLLCVYFLLRYRVAGDVIDLFQALTVAAFAVTIKVSAGPLFLFLMLFGAFVWRQDRRILSSKLRLWIPVSFTTCAFFGIWVVRSICLSGYLVFPVPATALTFLPWHLPVPMAGQLVDTLKAWARSPGVPPEVVLSSSAWIRDWMERLLDENVFYSTLAYAFLGLGLIIASLLTRRSNPALAKCWPAAAMLCFGLLYWFLTAPDPRYGYGYLFALACLALAIGIDSLFATKQNLGRILVCCTALVPLVTVTDISHFHLRDLPQMEVGRSSLHYTEQGTVIYVAEGDQRILGGPLPSTPYFRPTLLTRRNAQGRIVQFELPQTVNTPYYGIIRAQSKEGPGSR